MTTILFSTGDFLIRIKNAVMAKRHEVIVPSTKFIEAICKVLIKERFVTSVTKQGRDLKVAIAYRHKEPVLMDVTLVSKPGLRIYKTADEIKSKKGASILIISTSKGVVSSKDAVRLGVGGEVIAEIL